MMGYGGPGEWLYVEDLISGHAVPDGDLRPHELSGECWCRPVMNENDDGCIVVHNALDGREAYETGELRRH